MNQDKYKELLGSICEIDDIKLSQLFDYYRLLLEYSKKMNLTTITEFDDVYIKHFYDSILTLKDVDTSNFSTLLDIGSGAGFPGLVLKIIYPNLKVTLLEPTGKRCEFLKIVISHLKLENIQVINDRAENFIRYKRESFDIVCARAVAQFNVIAELAIPFVTVDGVFLCLKGQNYKEELTKIDFICDTLGSKFCTVFEYELPNELGHRAVIVLNKITYTPIKYPRNYVRIMKQPL